MMNETYETKRLRNSRIQTVLLAVLVLLMLIVAVTVIRGIGSVERTLALTDEKLDALNMDEVNKVVTALQGITSQLREMDLGRLEETADALGRAAENLDDVDIEAFNDAVESLTEASKNFQKIDMDTLNSVAKTANFMRFQLICRTSNRWTAFFLICRSLVLKSAVTFLFGTVRLQYGSSRKIMDATANQILYLQMK